MNTPDTLRSIADNFDDMQDKIRLLEARINMALQHPLLQLTNGAGHYIHHQVRAALIGHRDREILAAAKGTG